MGRRRQIRYSSSMFQNFRIYALAGRSSRYHKFKTPQSQERLEIFDPNYNGTYRAAIINVTTTRHLENRWLYRLQTLCVMET